MIIKKDKDTIKNFFEDNSGIKGSYADFAAVAEKGEEVCSFLAEMSKNQIPVTVAGALTGNTGSGLPFGGAVLSLEKLNKIGDIVKKDESYAEITVEPGARIADIKEKAYLNGWMYPPDPTEKNATIGGNIATNASGGRGFKFGVTRDYIQSLKLAFSDGSTAEIERGKYFADANGKISFMTSLGKKEIFLPKYFLPKIKNAAGYYNYPGADLIDVFIGSDGTLAVTLEAVLKLIPHFKEMFGGIIFFNSRAKAYDFVAKVKSIAKEKQKNSISPMSLEYFDKNALSMIKEDYPMIPDDIEAGILFEQDIYENNYDILTEKWMNFFEENMIDTEKIWYASNIREQEKFRLFRHRIPERVNERVKKNGVPKVGTDFAVPEGKLPEIIDYCEKEFAKEGLFNLTFGHIGDNHMHANIIPSDEDEYQRTRQMYARIAQKAVELGGTVSAEHGIGKLRHIFLEKMVEEEGFKEMAKFKKSLDSAAILGRNNIFPEKYLF